MRFAIAKLAEECAWIGQQIIADQMGARAFAFCVFGPTSSITWVAPMPEFELDKELLRTIADIAYSTLICGFGCAGIEKCDNTCPCECHRFWLWMRQFRQASKSPTNG